MRPVGAELVHAGRQTDRQTDIANRRFHKFANAPNNQSLNPHLFQTFMLAPACTVCCTKQSARQNTAFS